MFSKKIIFSSVFSEYIEKPIPALQYLPEGYKSLPKRNSIDAPNEATVKACIPFLDALKTGYIITFPIDVCFVVENIIQDGNLVRNISMKTNKNVPLEFYDVFRLDSHPDKQIPNSLKDKNRTIDTTLKILNPWHIKTPPGYSCMFTNPFNRNLPFKIIDGVVDTDVFPLNINFPFFWTNDVSVKETHIPKGSPMALVIPFKREDWKMETSNVTPHNVFSLFKLGTYIKDSYKKQFWKKKQYK